MKGLARETFVDPHANYDIISVEYIGGNEGCTHHIVNLLFLSEATCSTCISSVVATSVVVLRGENSVRTKYYRD